MHYFAYGSNMDPEQMKQRCPDAEVVGIGFLADHSLCFPRLSGRLRCGVASIEPHPGHATWGVVYRLSAGDLCQLDECEGFLDGRPADQNGYQRVPVQVVTGERSIEVQTYVAQPDDEPPRPSAAYLRHILDGARHHGLPEEYVARLESLEHD